MESPTIISDQKRWLCVALLVSAAFLCSQCHSGKTSGQARQVFGLMMKSKKDALVAIPQFSGQELNEWIDFDSSKESLLLNAMSDYDLVTAILSRGVDPNRGVRNGCTPLMLAVSSNDLKMVRLLLSYGANPRIRVNGMTALDCCVDHDVEIAKVLRTACQ